MKRPGFNPQTQIVSTTQSGVIRVAGAATAGAMTTRAASEAFFVAGTNRAMFRFTLINHMCMDMEQVHDTSVIPDRIRQDVSRSPGGDSRVFLNNCIGCHAGMDPLAQAFAYYNFNATTGHRVHARRRAAEVLQQQHDLRRRVRHAGRLVEQPLATRAKRAARLELAVAGLR